MKTRLTPSGIKRIRPKASEYTLWDDKTRHFGIRVKTTGSMRYIHMAKVDGKVRRTTIGDPAYMPLDKARAFANDLNSGKGLAAPKKPCPTLAEYVEDVWLPKTSLHRKPSTRYRTGMALTGQLLPAFGTMRLDEIDRTAILRWFEPYSRTAPGGANRALEALSTIFNHALGNGIIEFNPAKRIPRNPKKRMTRYLTAEERERLLKELDRPHRQFRYRRLAIKMLLFTGCRANEILSLRWDEVGENEINLSDSKTGARKVWLCAEARAILTEAREMQKSTGESEFVFPNPWMKGRSLQNIRLFWRSLRERVGIPDVRLHDLRHSFATEAVRQGIPLPVVSKLLGHSTLKMTMRYTHVSNSDAEEAAERIAVRIANQLEGTEVR